MTSKLTTLRFGLPILLGAFALFFIQPLMGKILTPRLGGGAGVWITCMVFFQTVLFLGYLTAHGIRQLPRGRQFGAWACLAGATWLMVGWNGLASGTPFWPAESWTGTSGSDPIPALLLLLCRTVGAPFLLLSSLSPLLQAWLADASKGRSPFRYYALSNLGSFLGLLSYPFLAEPLLSTPVQAWALVTLLATVTLLTAAAGLRHAAGGTAEARPEPTSSEEAEPAAKEPTLAWFLASASGSLLLVAASNAMSSVLSIPLVWIAPLGTYLLTFVLVFDARWDFSRPRGLSLLALGFSASLLYGLLRPAGFDRSPLGATLCFTAVVTCGCLVCHSLLHRLRPPAPRLTRFYLWMGAGGAMGGWAGALAAPLLFNRIYELPLAATLVATCALLWLRWTPVKRRITVVAPGGLLILASGTAFWAISRAPGAHYRDFFGTLTVQVHGHFKVLQHGRTTHGIQLVDQPGLPLGYYSQGSPLGQLMGLKRQEKSALRIGILGLGAGSAAAYTRVGDELRIYEISPIVVGLAGKSGTAFETVGRSPASVTTRLGDGRRVLEEELRSGSNQFDVLLVDAFSGDQIPWHLLTREALRLFTDHLGPDGVLAFHVSNNLPIHRLVAANVKGLGLWGLGLNHLGPAPDDPNRSLIMRSQYVLVSRDAGLVRQELFNMAGWAVIPEHPGITIGPKALAKGKAGLEIAEAPAWTDARNSLSQLLWLERKG